MRQNHKYSWEEWQQNADDVSLCLQFHLQLLSSCFIVYSLKWWRERERRLWMINLQFHHRHHHPLVISIAHFVCVHARKGWMSAYYTHNFCILQNHSTRWKCWQPFLPHTIILEQSVLAEDWQWKDKRLQLPQSVPRHYEQSRCA